ncbi:MAG: hypothetical protein AB7E60_13190 [Sphingobium sp.]
MRASHLNARASFVALGTALLAVGVLPGIAGAQEAKRVDVTPYIGIDQGVTGPLKGEGDVLTYTNLSAGVSASVQTRRVEASIDVQYNHSFGWGRNASDQDVISGIVSGRINLAQGLALNAGGLATRVRSDGLWGASTLRNSLTSQIFSGYIGPSYATRVGDFDLNASYRLGYTRVEDDFNSGYPGMSGGSFDDSVSHSLTGSVGFAPDTVLPRVGLVASAGYDREDARQLDQRFENAWGRVDATVPVTPTVALVGGIGYEDIQISQRSPLLDEDGIPVIRNGRYVTDKGSPRALIYESDGIIWDAGVLWRPSQRTSLQARIGRRYGGTTFSGTFVWEGRNASFGLAVFDGIESFGRLMTSDVAALSGSNLDVIRNPFTGDLAGCAFSVTGGGQCFNDALTGITDANFRYRGVSAQFARHFGRWTWGLGAGYSQRKFITPEGEAVFVSGTRDQNWYGNMSASYAINDRSGINTVAYISRFDASGARSDVWNMGAFTSYYTSLTRRLSASASVGVDGVKSDEIDTIISAMGQVGMRYSF